MGIQVSSHSDEVAPLSEVALLPEVAPLSEEIEIKISADKTKAYLILNPSPKNGLRLDEDRIIQKLREKGVVFGIKNTLISKAIEQKFFGKSFVVAEGTKPFDGEDAIIAYRFEPKDGVKLVEGVDGRVDYRELGMIDVVRTGDILAVKSPAVSGQPGRGVNGEKTEPQPGRDREIPVGKNTRLSPDGLTLTATADGYVLWQNRTLNIATTYEIEGDVDMHVGNIYFVGPVKIRGSVLEGFKVTSEGDIEVSKGVENAVLNAGGNIKIGQGIVGKKCQVNAKGDVRCKFAENAQIKAKGNVIVEDAILLSCVEADEDVVVLEGRKGAIMGGKIRAGVEVNAKNIGSISEVATLVEVGIKPSLRSEIEHLTESLENDKQELREVRLRHQSLIQQGRDDLAEEYLFTQKNLENNIKLMTQSLKQIEQEAFSPYQARVSAFERIWPGVKLVIRTANLSIAVDEHYCTFVEKGGIIQRLEYHPSRLKIKPGKGKVKYWEKELNEEI